MDKNQYIQIMIQSLKKKNQILDVIDKPESTATG